VPPNEIDARGLPLARTLTVRRAARSSTIRPSRNAKLGASVAPTPEAIVPPLIAPRGLPPKPK
jgi:hypothetical protein